MHDFTMLLKLDAGHVYYLNVLFFLFKVMPIVIFMSTAISILYYLEVIPFVIKHIGRFLGFCMGTRPAESLSAAGNIFLGMVGILLD